MSKVEISIIVLIVSMLALMVWVGATSGPSCEERGGESILVSMVPITIMSGNVPITSMIPVYDCKNPKK